MGSASGYFARLACFAAAIVISGCAPYFVHVYSKVAAYDKSVAIPTRYRGAGADRIRMVFRSHGWRIVNVDNVKVSKEGNLGNFEHLKRPAEHRGGYSLHVTHRDNFMFKIFTGNLSTVLQLIDNQDGTKVFRIAGRGDGLVKHLSEALKDSN